MSYFYEKIESPVGTLHAVATDTGLHALVFDSQWPLTRKRFAGLQNDRSSVLEHLREQLSGYFAGRRKEFDIPLQLTGTSFQNEVWASLSKIPFGQTRSYRDQAIALGNPNAVRAVGRTNGLNRLCIVLPCHRVVGSDGGLTGYAGGLQAKQFLLSLEGVASPSLG